MADQEKRQLKIKTGVVRRYESNSIGYMSTVVATIHYFCVQALQREADV